MHWGYQYIRHLIDNLQDLLVIYSLITNSLFLFCQWNWQYFFSPDGALALASWFSPCCLILGPHSKYFYVWPCLVGIMAKASCLALPLGHMEMNLNEFYAFNILYFTKPLIVILLPDLTSQVVCSRQIEQYHLCIVS